MRNRANSTDRNRSESPSNRTVNFDLPRKMAESRDIRSDLIAIEPAIMRGIVINLAGLIAQRRIKDLT